MPAVDAWWERMECRDADPTIFEEPPYMRTSAWKGRHAGWADKALELCGRCDVRERCLSEAITAPETSPGREFLSRHVIGGVTPDQFVHLRRRARRSA